MMSNRYARVAVLAAALALVAVFVGWLSGDGVRPTANGPNAEGPPPSPVRGIAWEQIDTTAALTNSSGGTLRMNWPPLSERVASASAIVRAEMISLTESQQLVCKVERVIYGRVPGDVLHVEGLTAGTQAKLWSQLGRKPTDAEVAAEFPKTDRFKAGRQVIMYLEQGWKPDDPLAFRSHGTTYHVPPNRPLDEAERKIVETVRSGSFLSPRISPAALGPYLRASESVVRAELTKIGKRSASWKVEAVLHVGSPDKGGHRAPGQRPPPARIAVGLDTWRLRAESSAYYRALTQEKSSATERETKEEYDRLVGSELWIGLQAILFVRSTKDVGEKSTFKLIGILPDDPGNGKPIDQTEAKIREVIEKGEWRSTIYL